jgi:long-chain-fatty-acid--CoA ligase ACSBG
VIVVETNDMLKRFTLTLKQLPKVKAIVVWGEKALPAEEKDPRFFLWKDFLKLGASVADKVILEKLPRMKPGECSTLIYTSGTTGMPKGCMLSHDSLVWESIPLFAELNKSFPDFSGN